MCTSGNVNINIQDRFGQTPLLYTLARDQYDIAHGLFGFYDINVNIRDFFGRTALMYAAFFGYVDIANELIRRGTDVNARDKWGRTALTYAKQKNHYEIVNRLLGAGAADLNNFVNANNNFGDDQVERLF